MIQNNYKRLTLLFFLNNLRKAGYLLKLAYKKALLFVEDEMITIYSIKMITTFQFQNGGRFDVRW